MQNIYISALEAAERGFRAFNPSRSISGQILIGNKEGETVEKCLCL